MKLLPDTFREAVETASGYFGSRTGLKPGVNRISGRLSTGLMFGISLVLCALCLVLSASAADWPQWGGQNLRNMYSTEKNLPAAFGKIEFKPGTEEVNTN